MLCYSFMNMGAGWVASHHSCPIPRWVHDIVTTGVNGLKIKVARDTSEANGQRNQDLDE